MESYGKKNTLINKISSFFESISMRLNMSQKLFAFLATLMIIILTNEK